MMTSHQCYPAFAEVAQRDLLFYWNFKLDSTDQMVIKLEENVHITALS